MYLGNVKFDNEIASELSNSDKFLLGLSLTSTFTNNTKIDQLTELDKIPNLTF